MHRLRRFLLLLAFLAPGLRAGTPPPAPALFARQGAALLGPTVWKRVILIQNTAPQSRYPRSLAAVVFELGGILWFYTPTDGTQSLSREFGRAETDKLNFGPLLPDIDPGFTHWEDDREGELAGDAFAPPPNACFLECLALLRRRLAAGLAVEQPRLLSYYVAVPGGVRGHTVLSFRTPNGPVVIDPHFPDRRIHIRTRHTDDAGDVADCLRNDVASARWVPIGARDFGPPADPRARLVLY